MTEDENHITHICPNCETAVQPSDNYCVNCGQQQTDKKLSLSQLFQDFIDSVFNVDARIWRTLMGIFVPGKLTQQYFRGRHQSYSNPIRFFLVTSIITFAICSFKGLDFLEMEIVESDLWKDTERSIYFKEFHGILDSVTLELKSEDGNLIALSTLDTLKARLPYPEELDSIDADISMSLEGIKLNPTDIVQLEEEELLKQYGDKSFGQRLFIKQFVRVIKRSGNFANYIWNNFPLMLLFMMPALALLMKLLYFRRGRYFIEHLVFSFHVHAFLFLLFGFLQLFNFDGLPDLVKISCTLLFAVYLFVALYRYYGQSIGKTLVKVSFLSVGYLLLFCLSFIITFFVSAAVF